MKRRGKRTGRACECSHESGARPDENQGAKERDEELQAYLDELIVFYTQLLRLEDWTTQGSYGSLRDLPENTEACISYDRYHGEAEIIVLHPDLEDIVPEGATSFHEMDVEESVVHELLHLRFIDVDREHQGHADVHEERAINALTKAIVHLVRELRAQQDRILELEEACKSKKVGKKQG